MTNNYFGSQELDEVEIASNDVASNFTLSDVQKRGRISGIHGHSRKAKQNVVVNQDLIDCYQGEDDLAEEIKIIKQKPAVP